MVIEYLAGNRLRGLSTDRVNSGNFSATGGSTSTNTNVTPNRKLHTFTSGTTNFVASGTNTDVEYLVIGGGGGGNGNGAVSYTHLTLPTTPYV